MAALGGFWKKFVDLLPKTPRQVGEVVGVAGTGRYTVTLVGGGTIEVRSDATYAIGTRVFVVGTLIEGVAPNLTATVIEV